VYLVSIPDTLHECSNRRISTSSAGCLSTRAIGPTDPWQIGSASRTQWFSGRCLELGKLTCIQRIDGRFTGRTSRSSLHTHFDSSLRLIWAPWCRECWQLGRRSQWPARSVPPARISPRCGLTPKVASGAKHSSRCIQPPPKRSKAGRNSARFWQSSTVSGLAIHVSVGWPGVFSRHCFSRGPWLADERSPARDRGRNPGPSLSGGRRLANAYRIVRGTQDALELCGCTSGYGLRSDEAQRFQTSKASQARVEVRAARYARGATAADARGDGEAR
jgi:hypothetical protein